MMATGRPVVVGIDGSEESRAALRWALEEARTRQAGLRLVYVHDSAALRLSEVDLAAWDQHGKDLTREWVADAEGMAAGVEVEGVAVTGQNTRVLTAESVNAAVMVMGARRLGRFGALLGSVSSTVAAQAKCPVVVVRGAGDDVADPTAPVVVGVDGTERSDPVLEYAFDHASRHGRSLRAVHNRRRPTLGKAKPGESSVASSSIDPEATKQAASSLAEALRGWPERYPDVQIEQEVGTLHPVEELAEASANASLVVVGARGRHAVIGTLLGSVSQGVLHRSACPVAVVHNP